MTVTEAPRDEVVVAAETEPAAPAGLAALVGSGDPVTTGKLFVGTSLLFLLVSGVTGILVGFEQVDTSKFDVLGTDSYAQVYTLHTVSGLFLVVLPLLIGLATAIVPLQVGAATIAFPRASAAAYWVFLVCGGLLLGSYAINGGPFGGDEAGVALFVLSLGGVIAALCTALVSIATTVFALRAPGMSLRRIPLFSWSMLVASTVWLLTLAVLGGTLILFYVDFTYGQQLLGNSGDLYGRVRWVFWQPTVYVFAIPALGIVGDIVPVFAQRRHKQHAVAMVLIGLYGALSFGAWTQLGVSIEGAADNPWLFNGAWRAVTAIVLLPVLGLLGLWSLTLASGRPKPSTPLIFGMIAGALLVLGIASGLATGVSSFELFDTAWTTAQAYVVLLATLSAGLGGLIYWAPKLYGRLIPEGIGRLVAPLLFLGALAVAVPYGIAGALDEPNLLVGAAGIDDVDTIETLNLVAAIGTVVVVIAGVLFILGLLRTWATRAANVGDDPWDGHTLEWATSSPPPIGNFAAVPAITSEAPVYDARHAALAEGS
jgi:heme/copper-type cytochrome/quinol oxidase subunit 1